tara:strand:+ start:784 stop:1332 length:549 start_codon:yes stop_codon:yes gene_type:complete
MQAFLRDIARTFNWSAPKFKQKRERAFWIIKTLVTKFLQSDLTEEKAFDPRGMDTMGKFGPWKAAIIYYPVQKHYREIAADPQKKGSEISEWEAEEFYCECCQRLWKMLRVDASGKSPSGKYTYDSVMKQAQLMKCQATTRAILMDESQDLTACQVDWMKGQRNPVGDYPKQVFFVGDPHQM